MTDLRHRPAELTPNQVEQVASIKDAAQGLLEVLDLQAPGREIAIARTKIEEAVMWAVKAVTSPGRPV